MAETTEKDPLRARLKKLEQAAELGGGAGAHRQAARGRQAHRPRAHRRCCSTPAPSSSSTSSSPTAAPTSAWPSKKILGDGVVTGYGTVDGRQVFVFAQDFTVFGGSLSGAYAAEDLQGHGPGHAGRARRSSASTTRAARASRRASSRLAGYADIFLRNTLASGVVPQISLILGPCAGGAVYSPAITDFIFMVKDTSLHVHHRPRRHQDGDPRGGDQGGRWAARCAHNQKSRRGALRRATTSRLPRCSSASCSRFLPLEQRRGPAAARPCDDDPFRARRRRSTTLVPDEPEQALRHQGDHPARSSTTALLRGAGALRAEHRGRLRAARTAGRWASSPTSRRCSPGCLDIDASVKGARFVRFCDCFNIPLVTFVDVPGFLPGTDQEYGGIIKHGAKLLYAFAEATVPKVTVITRKAYGGAYDVMASKHIRADINFAYPTAEIAVMGPEGAVNIIFRNETRSRPTDPTAERARLVERVPREVRQPLQGGRARLHRRGHPPRGDARRSSSARSRCCKDKRQEQPAAQARQHPAVRSRTQVTACQAQRSSSPTGARSPCG